ncbi:MAG TPA: cytochrome b N-terminal domain-containing protein [Dissulfurispiraceae bacterium]
MSGIGRWFSARWPVHRVKELLLKEDIPGGTSFAYTLGSTIIFTYSVQIATGVVQLFFYGPTTDHAYNSVNYLRTEVPFGWLIHNMHFWGANAMVLAVTLHMIRAYVWGTYKTSPLTWLIGILLLLITMSASFTGGPLIWDQKGYWAAEVGSSIAGEVPVIGHMQKLLLRGGEVMGQLALSHLFALHIWIFAPLIALFIAAHIISFRTSGVSGTWDMERSRLAEPFWPDQAYKDVITIGIVFFVLIALSVFAPAPFTGAADPLNTSYIPKPEWNFLFMYQALKYFKGPWEPLGAAGVPGLFLLLLVILPFVDRKPERNPLRRPVAMLCLIAYTGAVIALTILGYLSPGVAETPEAVSSKPSEAALPGQKQAPVRPGVTSGAEKGAQLFQSEGCVNCHKVNGRGGAVGPGLSGRVLSGKDKEWLAEQLRNPKAHNPNTIMPSFSNLSDEQINDLVEFLMGLRGAAGEAASAPAAQKAAPAPAGQGGPRTKAAPPGTVPEATAGEAAFIIGNAENGADFFKRQCASCHGQEGKGSIPNPGSAQGKVPALNPVDKGLFNREARTFAENIDKFIQHGATPPGPKPLLRMPAFGDTKSLTQQEIANVEAYILKMNGVDRTQLTNPGMQPRNFFRLVLAVYILFILVQGGIRIRRGEL